MILWMKAKLTTVLIAAVAVLTVAGAGAVLAATSHNATSPTSTPQTSEGAANQFEAQGVIQQVTFDQGTTQTGHLVFLPNGQQAAVTVIFTTATHIEVGGDTGDSGHDQNDDDDDAAQPGVLQAGLSASVEGVVQADGSVLASEINANGKDANDNDDNDGNGDNNDQEDQRLFGTIQSVDQGAQTLVLLQDGQTTPVTIAFDAQTRIDDDNQGDGSRSALTVGEHVRVEVVTRSDGSLYAKEIKPASANEGDGDNGGSGSNSGSGSDDSGSGHGGSGGDNGSDG